MHSTNDVRKAFIDYFAAHGHSPVGSSSLVPHNDPTLLFTSAGMVQFKNLFTGLEKRAYDRAVTSQKCLRAGGKHNDLDNVGYTARHHTFFEMLGNFSFGAYFKDVAIELAWNMVTREFGLAKDKLWVTIYHDDDDAHGHWRKISGLSDERIVRIATSDNFWSMGDVGPCGPCSEIFYDHGNRVAGGPPGSPDADGDRFVEIWNLVFMQFEQQAGGERVALPRPSIDTGMGLERLAAVLQGVHDNYDTDGLRALIMASAEATSTAPDGEHAVSHRVIADHLRAVSFLMADGVMPSNEGRGYVLRRIMRRAMRHVHLIGAAQQVVAEPMMWRLVPALITEMGAAYPELGRAQALITETLKLEEGRFKQTLDRGLRMLDDEVGKLGPGALLPGEVAFRLYDTFGFPLDLTQDALRGQGRTVEVEGFERAMARQRTEARAAWAGSGEAATETVWFEILDRHGATEFLGYETGVAEGRVEALVVDGALVETAAAGTEVAVIVSQTPFYAESGGQVGDSGVMFNTEGVEIPVADCQKKAGGLHVHGGRVASGAVSVGDVVEMRIDGQRRAAVRANHSATHLLHAALHRRLGDHVTQKGSLVAPDRLRFDIAQPAPLSDDDIAAIEDAVARQIQANGPVETRLMAPEAAVEAGALALFGEKYGEEVRVLSMGEGEGAPFSVELCGGTHVARTGEIGAFRIVGEGALAAGVRRIEALTGAAALDHARSQARLLVAASQVLKVAPADLPQRIGALQDERRRLERELADMRRRLAAGGGAADADDSKDIGGVRFVGRTLEQVPPRELKTMVDDLKDGDAGVYAIVGVNGDKASLVVGVTDGLTDRFDAVALTRLGVAALGGKGGGGRPDMAQGGGSNPAGAQAALAAIEKALLAPGTAALAP